MVPSFITVDGPVREARFVKKPDKWVFAPNDRWLGMGLAGEILDVAVDVRRSSANFGKWEAVTLSDENKRIIWIPPGFAHGFRVISEAAHVLYKATDYYAPEYEQTLAWNDPDVKIDWKLEVAPIVSAKDQRGISLRDVESFE